MNGTLAMLAGLCAGLAAGALLPAAAEWAEPVGLLWFNGLRMTVIPIVMSQLILGLNTQLHARALGALGIRAAAWFLALLTAAATFSAVATPFLLQWMPAVPAPPAAKAPGPIPGFGEWVAGLLPSNILQAAVGGQLLALIFFALLFGAAIRQVQPDKRQSLLLTLGGVNDAMLTIVAWLLRVAPLGVGALAVTLAARFGAAAAGTFGYYVLMLCGIILAVTVALYPLVQWRGRVPLLPWAKAVAPVQALAFTSRSSMAALPAMVNAAETRLALGPAVTGFVLPLAVSVFRYTATVAHVSGAIFIAQIYGIHLSLLQMVMMVVTSVFLTFSAPGIPSGGLLVALPLYHQLGLPAEGLGLLIAADAIPDMCKTVANVTAHMAVAAVVSPGDDTIGE